MKQLVECVPNISEGRDHEKIKIISQIVEEIDGVKLLNVDPGKATNRTVITFVGEPKQVIDAAFLLIQKAQELIDMSKHTQDCLNKCNRILIVDEQEKSIARGLSSFSSSEIDKIKWKQSDNIIEILGYPSKSEVVHKDDMVKL